MARRHFPTDILSQSVTVKNAWQEIDSKLAFGNLAFGNMLVELEQAQMLTSEIDRYQTVLVNKINQRDEMYANLWDKVKRVRAGVKASFGDDSSQYEMVGGTRLSERKPRSRKTTTEQ